MAIRHPKRVVKEAGGEVGIRDVTLGVIAV